MVRIPQDSHFIDRHVETRLRKLFVRPPAARFFCWGADRPNIIFVLVDDLGYGDLGCYGQELIQTPRLDQMAAEGIRFTDFYAGNTVCAPSRSVLMTGQHMGHTHVRGNAGGPDMSKQSLRDEDVTVAEVLKAAGYRTALCGKWGLGDDATGADRDCHANRDSTFSTVTSIKSTLTTTIPNSFGRTNPKNRFATSSNAWIEATAVSRRLGNKTRGLQP